MAVSVALAAWRREAMVAVALVVCAAGSMRAQDARPDAATCDSVVMASAVDSIRTALYVGAKRTDGAITREQLDAIANAVATVFTAPRPFRLSVFSGPAEMRTLRRAGPAGSAVERRSPTVTGVYRFWSRRGGIAAPFTVRESLVPAFDSLALEAISSAALIKDYFVPIPGDDSMLVEVRVSSDSTPNAKRVIDVVFPVMQLIDAVASPTNLPAAFPEAEKHDSSSRGEVVLRFVVDRTGSPVSGTVEVLRASSVAFLRSALTVLPEQRFTPASIRGCAVAQVVSYPFAFVMPAPENVPPRH